MSQVTKSNDLAAPLAGAVGARRRWARRLAVGALGLILAVITLVLIGVGGFVVRLSQGPISLDDLTPRIAAALQQRLAAGYVVSVSGAAVEREGAAPSLTVLGLSIKDAGGREIISAPKAAIEFDPFRLMRPDLGLRRIALIGPHLKASISRLGEISLVAAFSPAPAQPSSGSPAPPAMADDAGARQGSGASPDHARHGLLAAYDDLFGLRGPFRVVDFVGIQDGQLIIDDQRSDEEITFSDVAASFRRDNENGEHLHLSLKGPSGEWSLEAAALTTGQHERRLSIEPKDAPVGDVLLPFVPRPLALAPDMPVSGHIEINVGADGRATRATGSLTAGAAAWNKPGEKSPLLVTDELTAAFGYDGATRAVDVTKFGVLAGDTRIEISGQIVPASDGNFSFEFTGANAVMAGASPGEHPVPIDRIRATGSISPRDATLTVAPVELSGKDVSFAMNATYRRGHTGGLTLAMQSGRMPVRALLALWPPDVAKDVRKFLIERLERGVVEHFSLTNSLDEASLADAIADRPLPDEAVKLSADVSDTTLRYTDDLPPLTSAVAHVDGTGRTSTIALSSAATDLGEGRVLNLSEGRFFVADTTKKPATAQVNVRVQGGADAFIAAMQRDAPKSNSQAIPIEGVSGVGDAHVQFSVTMREGVKPRDIPLTVQGTLSKLTAQDIGASQRLENAQLTFAVANGVMTGKGEGRFAGTVAAIELRREPGEAQPQIKLSMTLDDAARAKLGLRTGKTITGPMPVKISPAAEGGGPQAFEVEADLTRAAIDGFIPGWTKPAGKPGKLTFRLAAGEEQTHFTKVNLSSAPVAVTGDVVTLRDGSLVSAKFDNFKVSPGDDLRVEVTRGEGTVYKSAVHGAAIDLRPFIKSFLSGSQTDTQDADLDLKVASAIGFGDEKGSGLDLHLSRRGTGLTEFRFSGQIGKANVSSSLSQEGRPLITIETADAGAFLRFADLYRHMNAGTMVLRLTPSVGSQAGAVSIRDFSLRNEEALSRMFAAAPPPTGGDTALAATSIPAEAQFNRMQASFVRTSGRLDVREALIVGNQAGITLNGGLDFGRNTASLSGTFVPLYGLNNAFSKVPLFGPLLGGGTNEGLLGVNFHVSGSLSQPDLAVNPLSAITPGFLRRLFDVGQPLRDSPAESQNTTEPERGGR
jgi:hypothetical protein